jgi:DNA repair exonuclease SbcCD nuclease subunit
MLVALVTDTHSGWKNDSPLFLDYFKRFYDNVFFPTLRDRGISKIVHLGDVFERRKYINFHVLNRTRVDFLEKLNAYDTHILAGNHDTYFRETNEINALRELIDGRYDNIKIYEEPTEIDIDGLPVCFIPWLNQSNMEKGLELIANSSAKVLMGHLEIIGFKMDQMAQVSSHGLDKSVFERYEKVFSGHFHHGSEDGPIHYLGAPYEYTFADLNDPKGFHIFDTDTLEIEFIQNPERMFHRLIYDDRDPANHETLRTADHAEYENKYVNVVVMHKVDPVLYNQWYDALAQVPPAQLTVDEKLSLDVADEAEEQFVEFDGEGKAVMSDTLSVLHTYVDSIGMEIDKMRMKGILEGLYREAVIA